MSAHTHACRCVEHPLVIILSSLASPFHSNRSQTFFFLFSPSGSAANSPFSSARCRIARTHALLTGAPGCVYHTTQLPRRFHLPATRGEYFRRNRTRHEKIKGNKKENPNARPKSEPDSPSDALRGIVLVDRSRPSRCALCVACKKRTLACMHSTPLSVQIPLVSTMYVASTIMNNKTTQPPFSGLQSKDSHMTMHLQQPPSCSSPSMSIGLGGFVPELVPLPVE